MKRSITLEEMRQLQLDMLVKIHEYCTVNNLRYSLGGGTLLGAVRHKGYIPWDDDVDIMMPRPDYDKFCSNFKRINHLKLINYRTDETCWLPFAKVIDDRTVLQEELQRTGIYIDIFPIDGLPAEDELETYLNEYTKLWRNFVRVTPAYRVFKEQNIFEHLINVLKYKIHSFISPKRDVAINNLEKFLKSFPYETSQNAGAIVGAYWEKELMPSGCFKEYILLPFEGHEFYCIKDYDAYLTKHYGNYMQLPPKEQQVSNHKFEAWWKE